MSEPTAAEREKEAKDKAARLPGQILRAQLAAQVGAVDHPLAPHFRALGLNVRPGVKVLDKMTGEVVEVVHGGFVQAGPESSGA